jgi:glycosyltransferase involved in cell wall biosynthesis
VIPNGIDLKRYRPTYDQGVLGAYGIDPDTPFVLFVGRITRQKGIVHLLDAVPSMPPQVQVVLCAGSPDTPSIAQEVETRVRELQSLSRGPIVWISKTVPVEELIVLYSHASVFVCPSIYEPFGIINLEAMACETPVVASAVGGIPEVVVEGHTGQLVAFQSKDPKAFAHGLGQAVHDLLSSPDRRKSMGREARRRVELHYSWRAIAQQTWNFYQELMSQDPVQA